MDIENIIRNNTKEFNNKNKQSYIFTCILVGLGVLMISSTFKLMPVINTQSKHKQLLGLSVLLLYLIGFSLILWGAIAFIVKRTRYKSELLNCYMSPMVALYFENGSYKNAKGLSHIGPINLSPEFIAIINDSVGSSPHINNFINGSYNGKAFTHVTVSSTDKKSCFTGMIIELIYKKQFLEVHKIEERREKCIDYVLDRTFDVESIEFNKLFSIETNDKQELLYLLTPDIIEKLIFLADNIPYKIAFTFSKSRLYIQVKKDTLFLKLNGKSITENIDICENHCKLMKNIISSF